MNDNNLRHTSQENSQLFETNINFNEISGTSQKDSKIEEKNTVASSIQRAEELENDFINKTLPNGFFFRDDKLYYRNENKSNNDHNIDTIFISSRINVIACTRDKDNENHGRLLEFKDLDGHQHLWAMPMSYLAGDCKEFREVLMSKGLDISPASHARKLLSLYVQTCRPEIRTRCVEQIGWHSDCFVFPQECIGNSQKERVLLQTSSNDLRRYLFEKLL